MIEQICADLIAEIDKAEPVARAHKRAREKAREAFDAADAEYRRVLTEYASLRNALAALNREQRVPVSVIDIELGGSDA